MNYKKYGIAEARKYGMAEVASASAATTIPDGMAEVASASAATTIHQTRLVHLDSAAAEICNCLPLSSMKTMPLIDGLQEQEKAMTGRENVEKGGERAMWTPATPALNASLRQQLGNHFPRSAPLSILLLHVSQLEHIQSIPQSAILDKRQRYHASSSFLEQVLVNVRRAMRGNDLMLIHAGTGTAMIFPGVDQQGVHSILERVYRNVSLLQAETVIPPLTRETDIVMGVSSYPESGPSIEHLLYDVSVTARRFTLRPAITTHLSGIAPDAVEARFITSQVTERTSKVSNTIPFMQLPVQLPTRLKHLIPYHIALELRCAPVGRDHHCLTVALADPTNSNVLRLLGEITGLTIFPVSCEITALNALLANKW